MKNKYSILSPLALAILRLSRLHVYADKSCLIYLPDKQLPREVYVELKTALKTLDGKWNSKRKNFVLPSGTADHIHSACRNGRILNRRQTFQEFFTPPLLAAQMANIVLKHEPDTRVILEPSAGQGALVNALFEGASHLGRFILVTAVEIVAENIGKMTTWAGLTTVSGDFLSMQPSVYYNAVCMNPPFADGAWAKHVNHALKFLKPRGILVAVVPGNALDTQVDEELCVLESVNTKFEHTGVKVKLLIAIKGAVSKADIMLQTDYASRHGEHLVNEDGSDNLPAQLTRGRRRGAPESPARDRAPARFRSPDYYLAQVRKNLTEVERLLEEFTQCIEK